MRVPTSLSLAFGPEFQELIARFAVERELLTGPEEIVSKRFLARSIAPHVEKLSALFNRTAELKALVAADIKARRPAAERTVPSPEQLALGPYWKSSSNPEHLRLAYFLSFMPSNLFRVAAVWSELSRLGFRWGAGNRLRAIEFGAGPAAGACGIAAGERFAPCGLPRQGDWALLEQDKASLELGARWAETYFAALPGMGTSAASADSPFDWGTRPFHRKLTLDHLLPPAAPRFNLWVMSFFLNEFANPSPEVADHLLDAWERHLDDEGIVVIVEPALRVISRRLLELRRELLAKSAARRFPLKVLLPCLGHQACGALADAEDWCHEEVNWWRPPYLRKIDEMTGLDRKSLPFSYLVLARSRRDLRELLPALAGTNHLHRLVSPAHAEGKEREFFICGQDGKRRARLKPESKNDPANEIGRGDILVDAELRGAPQATRVERYRELK